MVHGLRNAALAAALVVAVRAEAQQTIGTVVRVDAGDLVIDVGDGRVRDGDVLPIYRPMEVRHPVTGRMLRDRFLVGHVRVVQAGTQLSLARADGPTARELTVGDVLDVGPPPAAAPAEDLRPSRAGPATPPRVEPSTAAAVAATPAPDSEQVAVLALFREALGRPPEERVVLYRAFLEQHPRSPYRDALAGDAAMMAALARAVNVAPSPYDLERASRIQLHDTSHLDAVTRWHEGQVPDIAVSARPDLARIVLLHARAVGDAAFVTTSVPLAANGAARMMLPVALDRGDGIEYFVEVVGKNGLTEIIGGGPGGPIVAHRMPVDLPNAAGRSRARFSSEMVSFSTKNFNDWFLDVEGDFLYRVQAGWLYGVRLGLATLYGRGGPTRELDAASPTSHLASFSSGFLELELRPMSGFAIIGRAGVGLSRLDENEGQDATLAPGGQIRVRIGEERGVNLVVGGEFLPQGDRAFIALAWELLAGFPMAAEVHVMNQPVWIGDIGVRVVYELGWRLSSVAQLSLRLSVQGRQIDHIGPGVGFAATFDW